MESQNLDNENKSAHDGSKPKEPRENEMVSEGAPTSVQYYNEDEQQKEDKAKLSPNDSSEDKAENTDSVAPETKINTDNI